MPSSFIRIVVLCAVLAAIAVAMPKIAPDLLASVFRGDVASPKPVGASPKPVAKLSTQQARPRGGRKVAIDADPRGHFLVEASVNGRRIEVIVDTGATTVALTASTARRLGISLRDSDYSARISTANGVVGAAPVVLSEIRLGGITIRDVPALVVPGKALEVNLLGMSFLNRLTKFEIGGGQLVLTE